MDIEILLFVFIAFNIFVFIYALWQSALKNNSFGRCHLALLGSFVWGDAVVISLFWILLSVVNLYFIKNINFFLFSASVFFAVRGFGETVYWLNQQFSKKGGNDPKNFWMERIFRGEAVWFAYQLFWQIIMVVSIICAVYFGVRWLR